MDIYNQSLCAETKKSILDHLRLIQTNNEWRNKKSPVQKT